MLGEVVALVGDEVVGHVGVSHCWLDARQELVDVAMLSPLSTEPAHQASGIGTSLVAAAVEDDPRPRSTGAVPRGKPRVLRRAWLLPGQQSRAFEAPSRRTPEAAFQVVTFDSWAAWMTGRVVYPDVWWRHDAAGLRDPDLAFLEDLFARDFPPA